MIGVGAADMIGELGLAVSSHLTPFDPSRFADQHQMASEGIGKAALTVVLLSVEGISQTSRGRRWSTDRIGGVGAGGSPATSVLHDVDPAFEVQLEAVDSMTITTVMDNVSDILMPDQGPAKRLSPADLGQGRTPT